MLQAQDGMPPQHARARVMHDGLDLIAPALLVTMNGAPGASWFVGAELASVQPPRRIIQQVLAVTCPPLTMLVGRTQTMSQSVI